MSLISSGRSFHSLRALMVMALSPLVFNVDCTQSIVVSKAVSMTKAFRNKSKTDFNSLIAFLTFI